MSAALERISEELKDSPKTKCASENSVLSPRRRIGEASGPNLVSQTEVSAHRQLEQASKHLVEQFPKTTTSSSISKQPARHQKLHAIYEKLTDRLKLRKREGDSNFRKMMAEFQGLNTFIDTRQQIQSMNLVFQKGFKSNLEVLRIRDKVQRFDKELKEASDLYQQRYLNNEITIGEDEDYCQSNQVDPNSRQGINAIKVKNVNELLRKSKRIIEEQGAKVATARLEQSNAITDQLKDFMKKVMPVEAPIEVKDDTNDFYNNLEKVFEHQSNMIEQEEYEKEFLRRKQEEQEKEDQLRRIIKQTKYDLSGGADDERSVPNQSYFEEFHKRSQLAINKAVRESNRIYRQKMGLISHKEKLFTEIKEKIIDKTVNNNNNNNYNNSSNISQIESPSITSLGALDSPTTATSLEKQQQQHLLHSAKLQKSSFKEHNRSHSTGQLHSADQQQYSTPRQKHTNNSSYNNSESSSQMFFPQHSTKSLFSQYRSASSSSQNVLHLGESLSQIPEVTLSPSKQQQKRQPSPIMMAPAQSSLLSTRSNKLTSSSASKSSSKLNQMRITAVSSTTSSAQKSSSPFVPPLKLTPKPLIQLQSPLIDKSPLKSHPTSPLSSLSHRLNITPFQNNSSDQSSSSSYLRSSSQNNTSRQIDQKPPHSIINLSESARKSFGTISEEVKDVVKDMRHSPFRLRSIQNVTAIGSTPSLSVRHIPAEDSIDAQQDQMKSFIFSMKQAEGAYKAEKHVLIAAMAEAKMQFQNTSKKYDEPEISSIREVNPNEEHRFKTYLRRNLKHKSMQVSNY